MSSTLVIREYQPNDKSFIYATWLKGCYHGHYEELGVPKEVFYAYYPAIIDRLFASGSLNVLIAALSDDPSVIVGYLALTGETAHWAYTKAPWRNTGVLSLLMAGSEISYYTHQTKPGRAVAIKRQLTFNPFLV